MAAYKTSGRWRDHLTVEEAAEVVDLETIIDGSKKALDAAMARRAAIQKRSHARYVWRRDHIETSPGASGDPLKRLST